MFVIDWYFVVKYLCFTSLIEDWASALCFVCVTTNRLAYMTSYIKTITFCYTIISMYLAYICKMYAKRKFVITRMTWFYFQAHWVVLARCASTVRNPSKYYSDFLSIRQLACIRTVVFCSQKMFFGFVRHAKISWFYEFQVNEWAFNMN